MTTKCVVEVSLNVTGVDTHPDDITRFLGLSPTKTWRAGDLIGKSFLKRKEDGWAFGLPKEETIEFGHELLRLLDALAPYQHRIVAAPKQLGVEMELSCAIYTGEEAPIMHLGIDLQRRIADLGADLDIDLIFN